MDYLIKIGQILFILFVVFLWNKFMITTIVKKVVGFHKSNNKNNLDKQPVKFFINNELNIINFAQYFYWFGGIVISLEILLN